MDHAEALEHIELAAVEPQGLERLMAGDTPAGAAVAGHLAGCAACAGELARIGRTAAVVRDAIAAAPDPALRDRTLAFVRELGRDRSPVAAMGSEDAGRETPPIAASAAAAPPSIAGGPTRWNRWIRWGAIAAALVLAVGVGYGIATVPATQSGSAREVAVLAAAAREAVQVAAQPDARHVELVATGTAPGATGRLVLSPSAGDLVMVAEGLPALGPGEEYGCWVEADGVRTRIGRMYPGGSLQAWAGQVDGLADLPPDAVFGVSRVPAAGGTGEPVLTSG